MPTRKHLIADGKAPLPRRTRNFYATSVVIHAFFNLTAIVLTLTGVVPTVDS